MSVRFSRSSVIAHCALLLLFAVATAACRPSEEDRFANVSSIDPASTYAMIGVESGKCLVGMGTAAGVPIHIAGCDHSPAQQFRLSASGSYYTIRNVASSLCFGLQGASTTVGAPVVQGNCSGASDQLFTVQSVSGGAVRFSIKKSGQYLDVSGHGTSDGTAVIQWPSTGGANQSFELVEIASAGTPDLAMPPADLADMGQGNSNVFNACRFHFGTIDSIAKNNPSMIPQLDFFTPGWMGSSDTFNLGSVCSEGNPGGVLANQVPVIVAYVAAFYAKRHFGLCDCNVDSCGAGNDLCHTGAADIQDNLPAIIEIYQSYARGFASCYGTTRPIVFEMEPDWYQYTYSSQTKPMSEAQAGAIMGQFVDAIRQYLPNAVFSMDISPWVGNNGADNGAEWFSHFDMSKFTFINTSGGGTDATSTRIRASNQMTWAGVHKVTGKPILADTGYGVNGAGTGQDGNWDDPANIDARIADGVLSVSQYNPVSTWGTTIAANRAKLTPPGSCP